MILKCWMMWEYGIPEHNNATLWVSLWGGRREVSWPESDTRYPAAPCDPAKCLHLPEGSKVKWGGDIYKKKKNSLTVAGCLHWPFNNELPHSPCRWAPDVGCWRTSCPAGSGPPPRASASTLHQTLWASECHQAEGTLQKIQRCESARVGSCAHLVFRLR